MRVEPPPGYVPPEPTHPTYGYLTPQEREEIVPGVPAAVEVAEEPEPVAATWSPPVTETPDAEEATVRGPAGFPKPPSEVPAAATLGEFRWDARARRWVTAAAVVEEEPAPDIAAAAGGRGASSSWTSADGSTCRWDALAQQWGTEP